MVIPPVPSLLTMLLAVVVLVAIVVIARSSRTWTTYPSRVATFLSGAWSPVVAGLVTVLYRPHGVGVVSRARRRPR